MEDLRVIFKKGVRDYKYVSNAYNVIGNFTETKRELEKCLYIKDYKEKRNKLRLLLKKYNSGTGKLLPRQRFKQPNQLGLSVEEWKMWSSAGVVYGGGVWECYKREAELHYYINEILHTAEDLANQKDVFCAVCYLVDERFKFHNSIFDSDIENYFFSKESNEFIFDVLRLKELELLKLEQSPIEEFVVPTRKPLKWTGDITALGTMFGVLIDEKVIDGRPADVKRALLAMFEGLSPSTLTDNLGLKRNKSEARAKYHKETEKIIRELAEKIKKK